MRRLALALVVRPGSVAQQRPREREAQREQHERPAPGCEPKKNGTFSQAAFTGTGVVTHGIERGAPGEEHQEQDEGDGQEAAVVSAIRRTVGDQRASVSCIMPAMAGPVTASADQNTRLTR